METQNGRTPFVSESIIQSIAKHKDLLIPVIVMTIYLFIGALIFSSIEMDREKSEKKALRDELQNRIVSIAQNIISKALNPNCEGSISVKRECLKQNVDKDEVAEEIILMVRKSGFHKRIEKVSAEIWAITQRKFHISQTIPA